jgi:hypothetical protein
MGIPTPVIWAQTFCHLQSNVANLLASRGTSLQPFLGLTFIQLRTNPTLLAAARAQGLQNVDALVPGISAFANEVT